MPVGGTDRLRRYWDKHSRSYDRDMRFFDRVLFGHTRAWICRQLTARCWRSPSAPA